MRLKPRFIYLGRQGYFERRTPPEGYVCHRCKVSGMFLLQYWDIDLFNIYLYIYIYGSRGKLCFSWNLFMKSILVFHRTFYSALPHKWWSKLRRQKSETSHRYSKVYVDGYPRWFICFAKWRGSCFEAKWVCFIYLYLSLHSLSLFTESQEQSSNPQFHGWATSVVQGSVFSDLRIQHVPWRCISLTVFNIGCLHSSHVVWFSMYGFSAIWFYVSGFSAIWVFYLCCHPKVHRLFGRCKKSLFTSVLL